MPPMNNLLQWRALGRVFGPEEGAPWMISHAQVPTPLLDEAAGIIRVYFASRPRDGCSLTGFVDLDANDPTKVRCVHPTPLLELGKPGTFDEHGVMPSCAVRHGGLVYLYYSGWSRATTVPYTNSTGLAISEDGGITFRRVSDGPILAKSLIDPYSATSPFVMLHQGVWRMWYCSGTDWLDVDGKYEHVYDLKEASSTDGVHWVPSGRVSLSVKDSEQALTRPWVFRAHNEWQLWYCQRQAQDFRDGVGAYRIAHARSSDDLQSWRRAGEPQLPPPAAVNPWDRIARAYPSLLQVGSRILLFYNGDGFGRRGFGLASAELDSLSEESHQG